MQIDTKQQQKRQKRTQYMCPAMLRWIRLQMKFAPRDMYGTLGLPRRTYQDYESGERGIPAKLAAQIRQVFKRDREFMAGLPNRVDANLKRQFPGGMIPSNQAGKEEE